MLRQHKSKKSCRFEVKLMTVKLKSVRNTWITLQSIEFLLNVLKSVKKMRKQPLSAPLTIKENHFL